MDKKTPSVFNIGASSILIIFILLSLVSFATLSLITARSDYMLSRSYAERVQTYYAAQNEATARWNELNQHPQEDVVSYQIPVGDNQQLCVTLRFSPTEKTYLAEEWKTESIGTWEGDETLHLFPGA